MGKKGGMSWFTAVKRAFMSPTKDNEKMSSKRREASEQVQEEEKRRGKRRWIFRIPTTNHEQQCESKMTTDATTPPGHSVLDAERRHAIAVAAATVAAASAAAATAQAAVEIIRLTRPSNFVREQCAAAVIIQTAFRGCLARRALRALQGLVKLQALVRGHNARTQAKMMMKCAHALAQVHDQRAQLSDRRSKLSHEGSRKSMFAETNGLWESRYLQDIRDRKSISRDGSCIADDWDGRLHSLEGIKEMLQNRKEAALKREKTLAYAFSHQISRTRRNKSVGNESELEEGTKWLDRWMATKQWDSSRVSTNKKDVEIDTSSRYSYSAPIHVRRQQYQNLQKQASPHSVASPRNRAHHYSTLHQSPTTPPPSKIRPITVRSASPRCLKEQRSHSTTHTPKLGSYCSTAPMPNYMAATESAKARIRSRSTPRTRPSTPERERGGSAKKCLSYPIPEPHHTVTIGCSSGSQNLRSPSFKSVENGIFGMEQQSNLYSYYTDSLGGEISPCSTTDLRRR